MNISPLQRVFQPSQEPIAPKPYTGRGDSITTFMGTLFESLANQVTFGIYQPNIIPEEEEQAFRIASTIGHAAGSIGGFVANYELTGGIGALALSSFRWGRMALGAGELVKTASQAGRGTAGIGTLGGKALGGMAGISAPASIMATQEAAREFVRQVKEKDPDAAAIGEKALLGFMQGGIYGWMGEAFKYSAPVAQAISGGTAFAAAEAMQLAHEGDEITKENMGVAFLTGASLSLIGARGWKRRRDVALDESVKAIESMKKLKTEVEHMQNFKNLVAEYGDKNAIENIDEGIKLLKKASISKIFDIPETPKGGKSNISNAMHKAIKATQRKAGIEDTEYRKMIMEVTGGRTAEGLKLTKAEGMQMFEKMGAESQYKSPGEYKATEEQKKLLKNLREVLKFESKSQFDNTITKKQAKDVLDEISDYAEMEFERMGMNVKFKEPVSGAISWATPRTQAIRKMGATDFLAGVTKFKQYVDVMRSQVSTAARANVQIIENEMEIGVKEKFQQKLKNTTPRSWTLVDRLMNIDNAEQLKTELTALTPKQRHAYLELRSITNYFFHRTNEALTAMGKEPFNDVKGYLMHIYKMTGKPEIVPEPINMWGGRSKKIKFSATGENVTTKQRLPGEEGRETKRIINPVLAIDTMAKYDLKTMFLDRPTEVLKAKLTAMYSAGQITKEQASKLQDYIDFAILDKPTEGAKAWNKNVHRMLTQGKIGEVVNATLAKFGREVGDRPVDDFSSLFGKASQNAFIAFRASLGMRNSIQGLFPWGFTDTKTMAKAMGSAPEQLNKMLGTNSVYLTMMKNWEYEVTAFTHMQKTGNLMAEKAHIFSADMAAKAGHWQYIDHLNHSNPKYNWSTESGRKLREEMKAQGKKDWRSYMAPDENANWQKHVEDMMINCEFLYHSTGMPETFSNPAMKTIFKFQSYPMNYVFQYLNNLYKNAFGNGSPSWDMAGKFKYTPWERAGLVRHFVLTGAIIAGFDAALQANFFDSIGIAYSPTLHKEGKGLAGGKGIVVGSFEMRPSMAVDSMISLKTWLTAQDPYERKRALKRLTSIPALATGAVAPGWTAAKEVKRTIQEGEAQYYAFRKIYTGKKKTSPAANVFRGFPSIPSFK